MTRPEHEHDLEDRLRSERPAPAPGFRGGLRRRLVRLDRRGFGRPRHLHLIVAAYAGCGAVLLGLGLLGTLGAGPFAT